MGKGNVSLLNCFDMLVQNQFLRTCKGFFPRNYTSLTYMSTLISVSYYIDWLNFFPVYVSYSSFHILYFYVGHFRQYSMIILDSDLPSSSVLLLLYACLCIQRLGRTILVKSIFPWCETSDITLLMGTYFVSLAIILE